VERLTPCACPYACRWWTEPGYTAWIPWVAGAVQTALYTDFFYHFARAKMAGSKHVILPS